MTFNRSTSRKVKAMRACVASIAIVASGLGASPASADNVNEKATFHEHDNAGGCTFDVEPGYAVADLTRQGMWYGWWYCGDGFAENRISSVTTRGSAAMLFEHKDFQGKIVCVQPHAMRNLAGVGFNDTASSVLVRSGSSPEARRCPTTYNGTNVTIVG